MAALTLIYSVPLLCMTQSQLSGHAEGLYVFVTENLTYHRMDIIIFLTRSLGALRAGPDF